MSLRGTRIALMNWRDLGHSLAGGSESYAWEFAKALVAEGASVEYVTARASGQRRRSTEDGIRVLRRGGKFSYYFATAWYLLTRGRRLDAVVDVENGIPVFAPVFLPKRTPVVLVVHHVHLDQFRTYFPKPLSALGRFLEGTVMPRVYRDVPTVAVSESTREQMAERLGWQRPVGILPNGTVAIDRAPRASVGDRVVVLGRLATHKRIDHVIRAVAALDHLRPGIRLDVIGRGPEEAHLRALVADLGLQDRVTIHGYLDEEAKADLLSRARLHVCASDVEGWGQVVIEAAAHGVPTLARNVPGLRDSIRDGVTGWLVDDPTDDGQTVTAHLTAGLLSALDDLDDDDRRRKYAAACQEWAGEFTWERMHVGARALVAAAIADHGRRSRSPGADTSTARRRDTARTNTNNGEQKNSSTLDRDGVAPPAAPGLWDLGE